MQTKTIKSSYSYPTIRKALCIGQLLIFTIGNFKFQDQSLSALQFTSFIQCLLSACYVPGNEQGSGVTGMVCARKMLTRQWGTEALKEMLKLK